MEQATHSARAAAIYLRTASTAQFGEDSTLERQRRICEARARHLGLPIAETYTDIGVSGLTERRPGLDRLLADLEHGHIGYVITADGTRLARSRTLAASLISKLRDLSVKLITARH